MNILLAVDGSEHSQSAVQQLASRPWPEGSTVRVLYVVPGPMLAPAGSNQPPAMAMGPSSPRSPIRTMEAENAFVERASAMTEAIAKQLQERGIDAHTKLREGDARSEIVDEAERWPADLIVMGSHGYTGLRRWLLGSVAQSVVSHAPCSVEVVRGAGRESAS